MTGVKDLPVRRVTDGNGRKAKGIAARNQLAWTVAGLALLALVVIMRTLFPPPALAGQEAGALPLAGEARPAAVNPQAKSVPVPGATTASDQAGAQGQAMTTRPDDVSELEWQVLQGVAAKSRDPARTLSALVAKLRFSKQLELFRSGSAAAPRADSTAPPADPRAPRADLAAPRADPTVPRADLAAQLLADLPARVAAGDMARDEALRLLPALVEPLEPDPASRAARVRREAAKLPGQALQAEP